jgi:hypothetical protein
VVAQWEMWLLSRTMWWLIRICGGLSGRLGGPVGDVVAQWLAHQAVAFRFRVRVQHLSSLRLTDISMWLSPRMVLGHGACGEPTISLHSHHVSLFQWATHLLSVMRDPGSIPRGDTYVEPGFSCYRCLATLL